MPKILVLDRFYFPDEQATSIYLTELVRGLAGCFEFNILCGPPVVVTEDHVPSHQPPAKVFQVLCLNLPKRILFARFLNDLSFLVTSLLRSLFLARPDLLVTQTAPPGIWWVGAILSWVHRVPWIHVSNDMFPENLRVLSRGKFKLALTLVEKINSSILKRAKRIIVIGEDMKKKYLQKGFSKEQIMQIYYWADIEFIRPLPKDNPFTRKYGLVNKFVILYAGNFGRVHNFEDLFLAAEKLRNNGEIIFVLVGEGALRNKLLKEIQTKSLSNIKIIPFQPRSRLPEVLAAADVSVILLKKGMAGLSVPSKIYSILASGRPILACVEEESDIAKMVRESNSGFVVQPGRTEDLTRAITALFESQELRTQLGANARRFSEEQDFQTKALQGYKRSFLEVLNNEKVV